MNDSGGNVNYLYSICTLEFVIPMKVEDGLGNIPNNGVFFTTRFMMANDWHGQEEAAEWYEWVVVSVQEHLWFDRQKSVSYEVTDEDN